MYSNEKSTGRARKACKSSSLLNMQNCESDSSPLSFSSLGSFSNDGGNDKENVIRR